MFPQRVLLKSPTPHAGKERQLLALLKVSVTSAPEQGKAVVNTEISTGGKKVSRLPLALKSITKGSFWSQPRLFGWLPQREGNEPRTRSEEVQDVQSSTGNTEIQEPRGGISWHQPTTHPQQRGRIQKAAFASVPCKQSK